METYAYPCKMSDIIDGTSHTFLIGETVHEYYADNAAFYSNGDWSGCAVPLNYMPEPKPDRFEWSWGEFRVSQSGIRAGQTSAWLMDHVRFIDETIDHELYRGLSTKAGGEQAYVPLMA